MPERRPSTSLPYRELLGSDEERAAYDQMITLACRVFPYVEGHKFYCEHWYTNLFFNKIREFGALLADKAFDSNAIIADLNARGAKIVISQHPRRARPTADATAA